VGAYMREGDMVTRIVQTDRLRVSFGVPARYAALVAAGQQVNITSSSGSGETVAEVYAVDPSVNRDSRSIQARASIDNRAGEFTPGDFVRVLLTVGQDSSAILIPADAIIPELNLQVVFIAKNGRAVRREVVTGARTSDRIQILEGLFPADSVITTGLMVLRDGSEVNVRTESREETP
jgi:membrane fusion protein, multidrug efflux system